jgi:hypothetical protein
MSGYEEWTHHDESVHQTASMVKEEDEMLDAIWPEF